MNIIEKRYTTSFHHSLSVYQDRLSEMVGPFDKLIGAWCGSDRDTGYWNTCLELYSKHIGGDVPRLAELDTIRVYQGDGWVMVGLSYWVINRNEYWIRIAIEDELSAIQFKLAM